MGEFLQGLFKFDLYKRSQGKIARQATFGALAVIVALAAWSLSIYYGARVTVATDDTGAQIAQNNHLGTIYVPLAVLVLGLWTSFRVVQLPAFADFLISVEAEMNKVSWPSRRELVRSSIVVILMIFFLAMILFAYDLAWRAILGPLLH